MNDHDRHEPESKEDRTAVPSSSHRHERLRRWAKRLAIFFTGQTLIQGLNLLIGFLLLRWMSPEDYAQYSVANAFHGTLSVLVDLGISGSIVALVGDRGHDPRIVGEYVRCARYYRTRLIIIVAILSTIAFPILTANQPWGWNTKLALWASIIGALFVQVQFLYAAPLLITSRLVPYYRAQVVPATLRLPAFALAYFGGVLSAPVGTWLNAASFALQGWMYRSNAASAYNEPQRHSSASARELWKYVAPLWPNMLWFAIHGQITLFILSLLGKTQGIAELAAISRIGQLFAILGPLNSVFIAPIAARASSDNLVRKIAQLLLAGAALCIGLFGIAFIAQPALLWFIGPKYAHLTSLLLPVVSLSILGLFVTFVVTVNQVRKWMTWQATVWQISFVTTVQVIALTIAAPRTPIEAIYFSLFTQTGILIAHGAICLVNVAKHRKTSVGHGT